DPARWPATERASLEALVARSPPARAAFDDAVRLARVLDDDRLAAPAPALRRAVLARTPQPRRSLADALADLWAALGGARIAAPAFALALAIGTTLGLSTDLAASAADEQDVDLVDVAQLATEYPEP
ncbi:MAG TPA: hypothetical protein VFL14_16410, partial [Xanthomonadales bacterium]|nr:hypothetical protein [Xanthomonadales bacterium]